MAASPFKIHIPNSELDLLQRKLELARLPTNIANQKWSEENGVTLKMMTDTIHFWCESYDWRKEEARLNEMPQYKVPIDAKGFGTLDIHFVHSPTHAPDAIPLLFVHGWPGSFAEVQKILPLLNKAGYHVVAPSLPGYGFSSYPDKAGFTHAQHGEVFHKLMLELGYKQYVVQGGDWGSLVVQRMARVYKDNIKAIHVNMLFNPKPHFNTSEPTYTPFEQASINQTDHFRTHESAYQNIQATKPLALGLALYDSPIGMLSWMADKLFLWADTSAYTWTPTELITWTLLHYFPGPTTGLVMYRENMPVERKRDPVLETRIEVPMGVSAFAKEMGMQPRSWAEKMANIQFWREHEKGGHFAAHERPAELAGDVIEFFDSVWRKGGGAHHMEDVDQMVASKLRID